MDKANAEPESLEWPDIRSWRVQVRRHLIRERLGRDQVLQERSGAQACSRLLEGIDLSPYPTLGVYAPMRGEIDIQEIATAHAVRGGSLALPVVVDKGSPVEFWRWRPGMPMRRGAWNILVPATREPVVPEALIVPLVGFDPALYRLGYGGGYYDRTLAGVKTKPYCVGLGLESGRLASIFPQAHDIPMDRIVTDQKIYP